MKTFYIILLVLVSIPTILLAEQYQVKVAWDPSLDETNMQVGYRVYYGTSSGNYTDHIDVGNAHQAIISNLTKGQDYYFATVAYNDDYPSLESEKSNELVVHLPEGISEFNSKHNISGLEYNDEGGVFVIQVSGATVLGEDGGATSHSCVLQSTDNLLEDKWLNLGTLIVLPGEKIEIEVAALIDDTLEKFFRLKMD